MAVQKTDRPHGKRNNLSPREPMDYDSSIDGVPGKDENEAIQRPTSKRTRTRGNRQRTKDRREAFPVTSPEFDADTPRDGADEADGVRGESEKWPFGKKDEFVGSELQPNPYSPTDGTFTPRWIMDVVGHYGTRAEMMVLSQLAYWFGVTRKGTLRVKIQDGGYFWVCKTYRELGDEIRLTPGQVRGAIRSLTRMKYVIKGKRSQYGLACYRLNLVALRRSLEQVEAETFTETGGR